MKDLKDIEKILSRLGAIFTGIIMLLVSIQVICRYLALPVPGIYESIELLLVAVVFLPLAYTQSVNGHIHMELIFDRLPNSYRSVVQLVTLLLSLAVFSMITLMSGIAAYDSWKTGDVTMGLVDFPVWPSKILIPVGCGFLCLRLAIQVWQIAFPRRASGSQTGHRGQ